MEIHLGKHTLSTDAQEVRPAPGGYIINAPSLTLRLPFHPARFYRHGWQSWSLAAWLDSAVPSVPISAPEFRAKDEDPLHAFSRQHVSAWVSAVETPEGGILLLGALGLGGRVELLDNSLRGFYETGGGDWFIGAGGEAEVFARYANLLAERLGRRGVERAPRVWCSWYSLYRFINEPLLLDILSRLDDLPFDVFQLDDGWQVSTGDWEANDKFPSGMAALADKIRARGLNPGLWLSPLIVTPDSSIYRDHPDWLLRGEDDKPVFTGLNWSGRTYALDVTHPAVLEWLDALIRKVRGWGYEYLKLDFLYAGGFPGKHHRPMPREEAYRQALRTMRTAAGDAYILACGALIVPSLGLCDGLRVGPDVTPYWLNKPLSVWLNNPNNPSTQNAIRTSLHRLWLKPLVHVDPDVVYFRSRYNALTRQQAGLLRDLALLCGFKATSDLPQWLSSSEREALRAFLEASPQVEQTGQAAFQIDGREVDFSSALPLPGAVRAPVKLATAAGLLPMVFHEVLPAWLASRGKSK
jgi:alpha-galactosidase